MPTYDIYNLISVKEYQNILPYLSRTLKTQRSWQVKYIFPTNYTNCLQKTRGVKARSLCYTTFPTQLCRIWFNWGAENDIEKWIVSRPSAIGVYVCMYIHTYRQTECDQGPRQLRLCGALYMTRLCLGAGSFSAVPVHSDPLSRRRRRHQDHCLRRSSDLVGRRE